MTLPQEIIRRKRDGHDLTPAEMRAFFGGYLAGEIMDYQMSAMLMAIVLRGMTDRETVELTTIMRDSGQKFDWDFDRRRIIDKHSTGGVGDKTSIVILPLCLLEGLKVPMMAGRGLGHTGGTLDKLEAVGFKVFVGTERMRQLVKTLGGAFLGQTEEIVPLDRRLYALRDVTATVESIPLIVGSILSKKLAEGLGGLVMDVKFGSGAFMRDFDDAARLAQTIKMVGEGCGMNVRCLLTSMNTPLGTTAGNALEIHECLELMSGRGPADTRELIIELAAEMVCMAYPDRDPQGVRNTLGMHLDSGAAMEMFLRLAREQGADMKLLSSPESLFKAPVRLEARAPAAGVVSAIDVRGLGIAVIELGGGRRRSSDTVDPWVGLSGLIGKGAKISQGETLAVIHANDQESARRVKAAVEAAYSITGACPPESLIARRL